MTEGAIDPKVVMQLGIAAAANALAIVEEATLLDKAGHDARAFSLSVLAAEELSKAWVEADVLMLDGLDIRATILLVPPCHPHGDLLDFFVGDGQVLRRGVHYGRDPNRPMRSHGSRDPPYSRRSLLSRSGARPRGTLLSERTHLGELVAYRVPGDAGPDPKILPTL